MARPHETNPYANENARDAYVNLAGLSVPI